MSGIAAPREARAEAGTAMISTPFFNVSESATFNTLAGTGKLLIVDGAHRLVQTVPRHHNRDRQLTGPLRDGDDIHLFP
jgi:hypothetical protein